MEQPSATASRQSLALSSSLWIETGSLRFVKPTFDAPVLAHICANGSSEMVTNLSNAVTTLFFNLTMLHYLGESGVASITIALYAQWFLTSIYFGFASGVAPVFSYNHG